MNRRPLWIAAVALVVGYWLASSSSSPIPSPRPNDRPVVRWFAGIAKRLLWVALLAEKPPEDPQPDHRLAHTTRVGEDGYPIVDNARGW
jgi:hypothetical protein